MIITKKFTMALDRRGVAPVVDAVQDDSFTRQVEIALTYKGQPWQIPSDATVAIRFKKSDGKTGLYDTMPDGETAYTFAGNVVTVMLAPEVLTAAGRVDAAVALYQGTEVLGLFPFIVSVAPNPASGQSISNNYYYLQTWDDVNNAIAILNGRVDDLGQALGQGFRQVNEAVNRLADETVKTVNGFEPDENGNVDVEGGTVTKEQIAQAVEDYFEEHPNEGGNGAPGVDGEDGFSPVATVTQTNSGAVISITDKSGTTTATITNGKDGKDGAAGKDGADGNDGYTPVRGTDYWTPTDIEEIIYDVADKLQGYVTPQMFGAKADGVTDDTKAINNALASGKNVFFPVGTYKVTSSLVLPSGIIIEGASGLSVIKTYITDGYVLKSASSNIISSANIVNMKFENGNTADATTHLQSGNFVHTASDMYMSNCRVYSYYDVFYQIKSNSYIVNCRFNKTYNSFIAHTTDSVIDGCYINASRYAFATKSRCFVSSFNSTSLTNCLIDYWYSVFSVSSMASGTITGNTFNRSVNVFHDTLNTITITGNIFTGIESESVDLSVLTEEQIASLEAEKWCVIKFDNAMVDAANHVMQSVCFTNNTGKNCDNYIYIADGVQVVPCNCEFRGNHITAGSSGRLAGVDAGFRNTANTESAYHSMQNIFFDFWDMKEYDELPSAVLIGDGAKRVKSYPYMKAICGGEIYTNMNGVWVKDGQGSQGTQDSQPCIRFVDDLSECVDKSKVYVFPDGTVYEYVSEEVEAEAGLPKFTNLKDRCIFKYKQRYSMSSGSWSAHSNGSAIIVPVPVGVTSLTLRLNNFTKFSSYPDIYGGTSTETFTDKLGALGAPDANGTTTVNITKEASITYIVFNATATQESDFTDLIITINEPIEYTTEGETIVVAEFVNTGFSLVRTDTLNSITGEIDEVRGDIENHTHSQYLTDVPSEYVTESELSAKGYLTQHQDLSAYAKKADIPTVPTKTSQLQNDSNFLTSVPSEYVTETELNAKGYLTQHQSLSGYAKTADHYTKTESDNKYQPKGNYLTSHQDISGKADKSSAETWTFTLADGSTVTKKVVLA